MQLPVFRTVPNRIRDDVVQTVALTLLTQPAAIWGRLVATDPTLHPCPEADRVFRAYVGSMVRNCVRDLLRRESRSEAMQLELAAPRQPELRVEIGETLRALEAATDTALRASAPRGRDSLSQLHSLARGEIDLKDLVARIAGDGADEASRRRARDTVYKRHQRARTALVSALRHLAAQGRVGKDVAARASEVVDSVFALR
ncbi:MAG: hypothetical protein ABMA64_06550 [Myxococcota bacterium]